MKMMRNSQFSNLAMISGIAFIAISPLYFYGALSVQITEGLKYRLSLHGLGATSFYLVAAIFATSLGRRTDRLDPISTLRIAIIMTFVSNLGITFSNSLAMVCLSLAIGGFGNALATPGIAQLVRERIQLSKQGLAYGFKQSATGLPTLVGGAAIPFVASNGQWRYVFAAGAIFSLGILFKLYAISLSDMNSYNSKTSRNTKSSGAELKSVYTVEVKLIAISFAIGAAVGAGLITFLPLSIAEAGLGAAETSQALVLASACSLVARFIVLLYMDRTSIDAIRICIAMMVIGAFGLFGLSTMDAGLITIASVVSYAFGWGWIGLITYKMLRISDGNLGANVGLVQSAAAIGSIAGPIALGAVYELSGFGLMWQVSALGLILSLLFLIASQFKQKNAT
jgi:predicted MFS family arabinose efflux permease